jgi:hypothetical protein
MLALGVPADQRAHTLRVLSEMLDRADLRGRVKFDGALFAVEQRLGVDECVDAYALLETTGVARRTPTGWVIPAIKSHRGPAGANAASMAVLARHLAENAAESGIVRDAVHATSPSRGAAQLAEITPIGAARSKHAPVSLARRMPVMAGSVAAAAALLFGILSFTGRLETANPQADLASRNGALPSVPAVDQPAATVAGAVGTVPSVVTGATQPSSVATTSGGTTASPGLACLLPDIKVVSIDVAAVPGLLSAPTWTALVTGTVTNTGAETAALDAVKIVLDAGHGLLTEATTLLSVRELAPGATGTFSGLIPAGSVEPTNPTATVTATNWKTAGC